MSNDEPADFHVLVGARPPASPGPSAGTWPDGQRRDGRGDLHD